MKSAPRAGHILLLALAFSACNQPFEPEGPVGNRLVIYGILSSASDTQYVRLSTTFRTGAGGELEDAVVIMTGGGRSVMFSDTTIEHTDLLGRTERLPVYVAYNTPVQAGAEYVISAATRRGGTRATARAIALGVPEFSLRGTQRLDPRETADLELSTSFPTFSGAFAVHFYLDFYALVDHGWELKRVEVPRSSYVDEAGREILVYPTLAPVRSQVDSAKTLTIKLDIDQYVSTRERVFKQYQDAPVVWMEARFVVVQVDDALYRYYYANNGPVDQSSLRVDTREFTNVENGLGVFGSSASAVRRYEIAL